MGAKEIILCTRRVSKWSNSGCGWHGQAAQGGGVEVMADGDVVPALACCELVTALIV